MYLKETLSHAIIERQTFTLFNILSDTIILQTVQDHKKLLTIAGCITSWDEVTTLGIWLNCDPNDLARLKGDGFTIKGAAYEILRVWYERCDQGSKKSLTLWESLKQLGQGRLGFRNAFRFLNNGLQIAKCCFVILYTVTDCPIKFDYMTETIG